MVVMVGTGIMKTDMIESKTKIKADIIITTGVTETVDVSLMIELTFLVKKGDTITTIRYFAGFGISMDGARTVIKMKQ